LALSVLTRRLVEQKLDAFIDKRLSIHTRDEVRLTYTINGNQVTITEGHADPSMPQGWTADPIAQIRFNPDSSCWTLYFSDSNARWHRFEPAKPNRDFEQLVGVVNADLSGVFWG
jgi:hypothetical protein